MTVIYIYIRNIRQRLFVGTGAELNVGRTGINDEAGEGTLPRMRWALA